MPLTDQVASQLIAPTLALKRNVTLVSFPDSAYWPNAVEAYQAMSTYSTMLTIMCQQQKHMLMISYVDHRAKTALCGHSR